MSEHSGGEQLSLFNQVTMYSKPGCYQCNATKRELEKQGIPFNLIDITQNASGRKVVAALGYQSVPVVVSGNNHWYGFRPDRIKSLIEVREPTKGML